LNAALIEGAIGLGDYAAFSQTEMWDFAIEKSMNEVELALAYIEC
jgi:hypothetical protein